MRAATLVRGIAAAMALPGLAMAQAPATYIVDRANGPGTHFVEIDAAVNAVPSGSVLLVRAGAYQGVVIDGKAMTILCDSNVVAGSAQNGFLTIRNTLPDQIVLVRGLQQGIQLGASILNCQGPVTVADCGHVIAMFQAGNAFTVQQSRQVVLQGCSTAPVSGAGCDVSSSSVVIERCQLRGSTPAGYSYTARPGLHLTDSDVQLVHSSVTGGAGSAFPGVTPGAPAAGFAGVPSRLRVIGLSTHALTGGTTPGTGAVSPLAGTGTVRIDPLVPLVGSPAPGPGVTLVPTNMPSLVSTAGSIGGTLRVDRHGTPGAVYAIVLGLLGPPIVVPGLLDPVWLDLAFINVEAVGVAPATGAVTVTKSIPNVAALRGVTLVWQAADLAPIPQVTNPTPTVVH